MGSERNLVLVSVVVCGPTNWWNVLCIGVGAGQSREGKMV
jgi:hypothetical protein